MTEVIGWNWCYCCGHMFSDLDLALYEGKTYCALRWRTKATCYDVKLGRSSHDQQEM